MMKRTLVFYSAVVLASLMLCLPATVNASGGAAGVSPGTNFQAIFKSGADVWIRIQFRAEGHIGNNENHAIGGTFGYDLGAGAPNFVGIMPYYNYHFNNAKENGPYVGGQFDIKFASNRSVVGLQAVGGYQHFFNDWLGIYVQGELGFGRVGFSNISSFSYTGADFGVNAGLKFNFGNSVSYD